MRAAQCVRIGNRGGPPAFALVTLFALDRMCLVAENNRLPQRLENQQSEDCEPERDPGNA
jgi:hypothetical protein